MEIGLVGQRGRERAERITETLRERLREWGADVLVDEVTAAALDVPGVETSALSTTELVVSVGGDGTFLYAARAAGSTPILGVNLGEVGFLNAISPDAAESVVLDAVEALDDGMLSITELPRVRAAGPDWTMAPAINEVLVQGPRRGSGADAAITVRVDGNDYADGVADGVLVATPIGSTAYNMSEGGPLVHPAVDAAVVTPMFPREGTRPLVVQRDASVELTVEAADAGHVVGDGRQRHEVTPPTTVTVGVADEPLRIAGPGVEFFEALGKLE